MWIITNRQEELIQKAIDYIHSKRKDTLLLDVKQAPEIREQIRTEDFKKHLTLSLEFGETFEPLGINVDSIYKLYGPNLELQKLPISPSFVSSVCANLAIDIPNEIKKYSHLCDYIINQTLKLGDYQLISSYLINTNYYASILFETLDLINLLELLAKQKDSEINSLLIDWQINISDIKKYFARDISLLQKQLN
jgi:hypothetical protein